MKTSSTSITASRSARWWWCSRWAYATPGVSWGLSVELRPPTRLSWRARRGYHTCLIASHWRQLSGNVCFRPAYHWQGLLQSSGRDALRKFGIRLFTLTVCAAALLTVPMVQPSKAAGNGGGQSGGGDLEKTRKKPQASASGDLQSPTQSGDLRSPTLRIWPPPMQDDFDRKAG